MVTIEILEGDITEVPVDAIVNAANNHLWMGAGVAGAIKKVGGKEIEEEAVRKGPIPIGEVVATRAGRLPAKYVIHAAVMGQDLRTDAEKIRQATKKSLLKADELGLKSIAFPALGTGVGGFLMKECAQIMIGEACEYISKKELGKIIFVLYGKPAYLMFTEELVRQRG
jgi:O-acetyl-ADP-ribose deacetylase